MAVALVVTFALLVMAMALVFSLVLSFVVTVALMVTFALIVVTVALVFAVMLSAVAALVALFVSLAVAASAVAVMSAATAFLRQELTVKPLCQFLLGSISY